MIHTRSMFYSHHKNQVCGRISIIRSTSQASHISISPTSHISDKPALFSYLRQTSFVFSFQRYQFFYYFSVKPAVFSFLRQTCRVFISHTNQQCFHVSDRPAMSSYLRHFHIFIHQTAVADPEGIRLVHKLNCLNICTLNYQNISIWQ